MKFNSKSSVNSKSAGSLNVAGTFFTSRLLFCAEALIIVTELKLKLSKGAKAFCRIFFENNETPIGLRGPGG